MAASQQFRRTSTDLAADAVEKRIEHALALIVRAAMGSPAAASRAHARLVRWRAAEAENEIAWEEAMRRWEALGAMAGELRQRFEPPRERLGAGGERRRAMLALAVLGCGSALLGGAGAWHWNRPLFVQRAGTATAQLAQLDLPDGPSGARGSHIDLDAATQLEIRLYRGRRVVHLAGGEARFEVARDADRPFIVETRSGEVEVLGTAFTVSDRGGPVTVMVERGHVRFQPRSAGIRLWPWTDPGVDLFGGDRLSVRGGRPEAVRRQETGNVAAWRSGWLVFDNAPLDEVLPAVNAYLAEPVRPADARVAALRFTGRFRAANAEQLLPVLPTMFPVVVTTDASGQRVVALR